MRHRSVVFGLLAFVAALVLSVAAPSRTIAQDTALVFNRVATIPSFLNTDVESETVAEIITASQDGNTLIYTDAAMGVIGFIDITDPMAPAAAGSLEMGGEPTSVAVLGEFAYAAVNTSETFTEPSGALFVINVAEQSIVNEIDLGGQPDSVSISPDGAYVAIVIENERDEDLGEGEPPQLPGGALVIFSTADESLRTVDLTGIADLFPEDPEPEFVDINSQNLAVVTLQENNYIVLVDLVSGEVTGSFSAGAVDLEQVDTVEDDVITLNSSLAGIAREPDAVTWISDSLFVTADEGDLFGGSRGFTIFDTAGTVVFDAGNTVEHIAARHGHYPEGRSENKGSEPEGVTFGEYESGNYLFVGLERASLVLVYRIGEDASAPEFVQALPTGIGPEGLLAIPGRDLFVVASETDFPGGVRSIVSIYQLQEGPAAYPTIASADNEDGTPITWGALSGLAADPMDAGIAYAIRDSFYGSSSMYVVDVSGEPAIITDEIFLMDSNGALAAVAPEQVNEDSTVNLDAEGITVRAGGGFWIASEGGGDFGNTDNPVTSLNLLVGVAADGTIETVVTLPDAVNEGQRRWGFEGVASTGEAGSEVLFVAFQREFQNDLEGYARIGRYDVAAEAWSFYYYPLESAATGWIGLSEITAIDSETFLVVERDNQADVTAAVKGIYQFSVAGLEPLAEGEFPIVDKTLVYDMLPDLAATGGAIIEKVEGFAILADGSAVFVTDNDGVDDSNGETQFIRIDLMLGE
ncbi:MAG: esterase-like activity of phytase family protein [Chloroflexota bacterium]|nr:esterase-like activity of phytase family protein [Chloroflexota bacterium]